MDELKGIKSWSENDRPREKLLAKGPAALSDAELLAILIGSGNRNESAVDLCRRILHSVSNDLMSLGSLSIQDLKQFKGMGEVKSITLKAALELSVRRRASESKTSIRIQNSAQAYERFLEHMSDLKHEEFWVMSLSVSLSVLSIQKVGEGGFTATYVDTKRIFKTALSHSASKIMIAHNHPSGNLKPSEQDISLTKRIRDAAKIMDIGLLDHIIVTGRGYYSFADEGILDTI